MNRGALVTATGTGFVGCPAHVGCGNVLHLRTHSSAEVLASGSPWNFSETASENQEQILSETTTGKARLWVETAGVLSNLLPVTVGK